LIIGLRSTTEEGQPTGKFSLGDAYVLASRGCMAVTSNTWHKLAVAASGGIGGFFGLPAVAVELPISTTIMLRSIADIARSEGEIISNTESQLACIEVFALGGSNKSDNASESGYFP